MKANPSILHNHNFFIGQSKNGLTEVAIQDIIQKYGEIARLEGVTLHILRHTFAKSLIDKGVDLVTVKYLMGHKRLDSTARYTKPSRRDQEKWLCLCYSWKNYSD